MHKNHTSNQLNLAKDIFDYLNLSSKTIQPAGVIIGFGHFDLKIPHRCGALFEQGLAEHIIFTGGIGSGTADLGKPEAQAFADTLSVAHPAIPNSALLIEDKSTNTSENIQFTAKKLEQQWPNFTFGKEIKQAILVSNAYRQRRVWLTCKRNLPNITFFNAPPKTTFEQELDMFSNKGFDFVDLLVGEIDRIIAYGEKGYLAIEEIPPKIYGKYIELKQA